MKKLIDCLNDISDDFQSTFTYVDENQLVNMLRGEHEFDEVSSIIKKHVGNVDVSFKKLNRMHGPHDVYEINISELKN